MRQVWIMGGGRVGLTIAKKLVLSGNYEVCVVDQALPVDAFKHPKLIYEQANVRDAQSLKNIAASHPPLAMVSALPFYLNEAVAAFAIQEGAHYFDLTEDVATTASLHQMATSAKSMVVPQCGLAPGWVGLVAFNLIRDMDTVNDLALRVGALPEHSQHPLRYALTWSVEGLINEYVNDAEVLKHGKPAVAPGLEGLESLEVDKNTYEAFNTSGGLGSLVHLCAGKVSHLQYKTLRYPGHAEKMKFLLFDLGFKDDRDTLKKVLERSLPKEVQDLVVIYVRAEGTSRGQVLSREWWRVIRAEEDNGKWLTALANTTASSLCAVMDTLLTNPKAGFVYQETLDFNTVLANPFAACFR